MPTRTVATLPLVLLAALLILGCAQNMPSENPPIHLNPNMDDQARYKAQGRSAFFADHSAMRQPVAGTVARGELNADRAYYTGVDDNGDTLKYMPVPLTKELVLRGKDRYNIYCQPCHGQTGSDAIRGIVVQRGMLPPSSYTEERLRLAPDGHIYNVITNGKGNMRPYRYQIPVADRWAIVAYVRALQRSQFAPMTDVPAADQASMKAGK